MNLLHLSSLSSLTLRRRMATWLTAALLGPALGCGMPEESTAAPEAAPELGTQSQQILAEQWGGVAEAVWRWYGDPEVLRSSYASPALFFVGGGGIFCSASMIGPNMLMTAAHCGETPEITASFLTYASNSSGAAAKRWEDFRCKSLVSTWHSSDLVLYYCEPNAAGQSPGDKYGYFDFDTRPLSVGTQVYSLWGNPLETPTYEYDVRFYSRGQVTSTTSYGTFTTDPAYVKINPSTGLPDFSTSYQRPIAISTDLWCNGGASGSAQIRSDSHRLAVGPLSTGAGDGRGRNALSIQQYLLDGTVDARDPSHTNSTQISALGLNPANYGGLLDKDRDLLFDLQTDIEQRRGENRRDWYWLGFDSKRRNKLWSPVAGVVIDADNRQVRLNHTTNGYTTMLSHRKLNIPAGGSYRISVMVWTASAAVVDPLYLGFNNAGIWSGEWVVTKAGTGWQMITTQVNATVDNPELLIGVWDVADLYLSSISVVREGSVMDFDTFDKRENWRNDITGARAPVVPRGTEETWGPDWAVRVAYDASSPSGWAVRNRQLALLGGQRYRVCFDYKTETSYPLGVLRVVSNGTEMVRATFSPGTTWGSTCTGTFTPVGDDNNLQLGTATASSSFLVDNVRIERQ